MDFSFIYTALDALIAMIDKVLTFFTSTLSEITDTPLPDWMDALLNPVAWLIDTLGWGDITMLEIMFVVGLPLILAVAFIKFFLPTS